MQELNHPSRRQRPRRCRVRPLRPLHGSEHDHSRRILRGVDSFKEYTRQSDYTLREIESSKHNRNKMSGKVFDRLAATRVIST